MPVTASARRPEPHEVIFQFAFPVSKPLPAVVRLLSGMEVARALFGRVDKESVVPASSPKKDLVGCISIYEALNWLKAAEYFIAGGSCDGRAKIARVVFSSSDRLVTDHYKRYSPDLWKYLLEMSLQNAWKVSALSEGPTSGAGKLTMVALEKKTFLKNLRVMHSLRFEEGKLVVA